MEETLDKHGTMGYSDIQDDKNVVVKMDEQRPANDTKCTHERLIVDPEDTIGDAIYHGCANPECGLGWYIK